jgi:hypothetical protein
VNTSAASEYNLGQCTGGSESECSGSDCSIDESEYNCKHATQSGTFTPYNTVLGNDGSLGANDITQDPQFVDINVGIAAWDTSLGEAGTLANAFEEMVKLNGWDKDGNPAAFNSNYTVANLLAYIRAGLTPQNSALDGTGYGRDDIGAVSFSVSPSTSNLMPGLVRGLISDQPEGLQ